MHISDIQSLWENGLNVNLELDFIFKKSIKV